VRSLTIHRYKDKYQHYAKNHEVLRGFSPVSGVIWRILAYVVGSHAAWPQIKMQEHKTARMAKEQQSSASGALLGELQFSVSARQASGGCRLTPASGLTLGTRSTCRLEAAPQRVAPNG
jgi:hypothetical protein